jgi:RNA polymerase sigma-70 factor (ECF subfamily)
MRSPTINLRKFRIQGDPRTATIDSASTLGRRHRHPDTVFAKEELVGKAVPAAALPREEHLTESIRQENRAHTTGLEEIDGLYGYALILTRSHPEAEDLVQETYVRAIPAMGRLRAESNMKSWLFTILRNVWLNQLRKRRNRPQIVDIDGNCDVADSIAGNSDDPYDRYVSRIETEVVLEAIQKLPPHFREILLLREYEELSYKEIASVINCPMGTVMSRLAGARGKLRSLLSEIPKRRDGLREL